MKVMVMVKASPSSEAGKLPSEELMTAMGNFNESLVAAGIMEAGEGLKPSSEGVRVRFSGDQRLVTRGPFAETNELVAGYWLWNVASMDEAIEWVKRCPNPMEEDSDIEIRTFYTLDDFAEVDPDGSVREQETHMQQTLALRKMTNIPYVFFSGRCEEALDFYTENLGAVVKMKMRFNEHPPTEEDCPPLPPGFENKVMHAEFSIGKLDLMASDGCDEVTQMQGFRLALGLENEDAVNTVFNALAEGGTIDMPLAPTFWSKLFGQVTDRFGMAWMVMVDSQQTPM